MGQSDVLKYLNKKKRWVDVGEMSEKLGVNRSNVGICCKKLVKQGQIFSKEVKQGIGGHKIFYCSKLNRGIKNG